MAVAKHLPETHVLTLVEALLVLPKQINLLLLKEAKKGRVDDEEVRTVGGHHNKSCTEELMNQEERHAKDKNLWDTTLKGIVN
jgi:hypothetical protein